MNIHNIVNDANLNNSELLEKLKKYGFELDSALIVDSVEENLDFTDKDVSSKLIEMYNVSENKAKDDIKYLIIFNADDISKDYSIMKGLYERLGQKNISILLVTNICLEEHHKDFVYHFYYTSCYEISMFILRNDIKKRNSKYTSFEKDCISFIPRLGTLERYYCKNEEVSKFYESLLHKKVFVTSTLFRILPQYELVIHSCDKPIKPEWDVYKKSSISQAIYNKDEITFVISDTENFTIKIPAQLRNFEKFLLVDNHGFIRFLSFLYGEHGENFLFEYKNNPKISEFEQKRLEKELKETDISYIKGKTIENEINTFLESQSIDLSKYITIAENIEEEYRDVFAYSYSASECFLLFFGKEVNYSKGVLFALSLLSKNKIDMNTNKITEENMALLIPELVNSLDYSLLKLEKDSKELQEFKDGMIRGFKDSLTLRKEDGTVGILFYEALTKKPTEENSK